MRVCHITSAHRRYDVRIFEKECTSLASNGYEVYLVVNDNKENETKNKVHIVSTKFDSHNRFERMISSMKYIVKIAKNVDADIYHFHDPELLGIARKLKKRGKTVIFDAHEDTEKQIMDKEWLPSFTRTMVSKIYARYSRAIYKKIDALITVTPALVKKLQEYNKNVVMITNYPIIQRGNDIENKDKEKYIFFAGGVSEQWCHHRIIEAMRNVNGMRYKIAGPIEQNYLEKIKKIDGWDKVDYLGKIPHNEVEQLYSKAVAGVAINACTQISGEGTLGNTKLFEVMAASTPVICTDYRLWESIISKYNCGITVKSDDIEEIRKAIEFLRDNLETVYEMGVRGRKAIEEEFNWENEEKKLLDLYEKIKS